MVWPAIIGAIGGIAGGLLSSSGQKVANERAADSAANALAKQEEFARHGLTWRAQDAMAAHKSTGLHPLAMLGVQGPTFTPAVATFGNEGEGIGSGISRAGQDISNAMYRSADRDLRKRAMDMQEIQMQNSAVRGKLENELLTAQIQSIRQRLRQDASPGMPFGVPGGLTVSKPAEVTRVDPKAPFVEPGTNPDYHFIRTADNGYTIVPSKNFKDRAEDMFGLSSSWYARNYVGPVVSGSLRRSMLAQLEKLQPGMDWSYHPITGTWYPKKKVSPTPFRPIPLINSGYGQFRR